MSDVGKIHELSGAAGYLCSAVDELSAAGYDVWGEQVTQLIEIIGAEIGWLQTARQTKAA